MSGLRTEESLVGPSRRIRNRQKSFAEVPGQTHVTKIRKPPINDPFVRLFQILAPRLSCAVFGHRKVISCKLRIYSTSVRCTRQPRWYPEGILPYPRLDLRTRLKSLRPAAFSMCSVRGRTRSKYRLSGTDRKYLRSRRSSAVASGSSDVRQACGLRETSSPSDSASV